VEVADFGILEEEDVILKESIEEGLEHVDQVGF